MEEIIRKDGNHTTDKYKGIVFSDFDGTLLDSKKEINNKDYNTLIQLKQKGFLRVIVTGRHLYSLFQRIDNTFPVDYVIFSSGAGIWDLTNKEYIRIVSMDPSEVQKAASVLLKLTVDFAVHRPVPDNHYFFFLHHNLNNHDFNRRLTLYRNYAIEWKKIPSQFPKASQLLAIINDNTDSRIYEIICKELTDFTVIKTTSPLDYTSLWIEIFPSNVSKGRTSSWLSSLFKINKEKILAIGNDFNDLDLLSWAETAFVVANAPDELKKTFPVVPSHDNCGFTYAIKKWLKKI